MVWYRHYTASSKDTGGTSRGSSLRYALSSATARLGFPFELRLCSALSPDRWRRRSEGALPTQELECQTCGRTTDLRFKM